VIPPGAFFGLAAVLFVLGAIAFFVKKDLLTQFMAVEIMLNAGNLAILALSRASGRVDGQALVLFVITVAAAEVGLALAIVLRVFRNRGTANVDEVDSLKW
jgi:NADH-quinone oxidoreductase subunit K